MMPISRTSRLTRAEQASMPTLSPREPTAGMMPDYFLLGVYLLEEDQQGQNDVMIDGEPFARRQLRYSPAKSLSLASNPDPWSVRPVTAATDRNPRFFGADLGLGQVVDTQGVNWT